MFKRRDIPPVMLLLLLIILVMLTLSQILVVHNGRYGRNVHSMRKLQLELREMDINLHALMMQNVPSIELSRRMLQNEINAQRVANIIAEASRTNPEQSLPSRLRGTWASNVTSQTSTSSPPGLSSLHDISPRGLHQSATKAMYPGETPGGNQRHMQAIIENDRHKSVSYTRVQGPRVITAISNTSLTPNTGESSPSVDSISETPRRRNTDINYCPSVPPGLRGRVFVNVRHSHTFTMDDIISQNPDLMAGGRWKPKGCMARHRVAVIIPYRDRREHLTLLLSHLHPILQRQQLDYTVFVVEQYGGDTFNKARIMNIAFVEALKQHNFQCFVFHDVDLVPEDDRNMYSCPVQPRHMSVAIDEMGYKLAYQELVGGVLNMRTEHFLRVNGYSNLYWGWGAEDDDMAYRIMHVGLKITRPPEGVARYKMIQHTKRKPSDWRKRAKLLYTGTRRFQFDGLNSLQFKIVHIKNEKLYTHVLVDIGKPPRGFK